MVALSEGDDRSSFLRERAPRTSHLSCSKIAQDRIKWWRSALHQIDVEVAIAVGVEEGGATDGGLWQEKALAVVTGPMGEFETRGLCYFFERGLRCRLHCWCRWCDGLGSTGGEQPERAARERAARKRPVRIGGESSSRVVLRGGLTSTDLLQLIEGVVDGGVLGVQGAGLLQDLRGGFEVAGIG